MKFSIPGMTDARHRAAVEKTIIDLDSHADVSVDLHARTAAVRTTAPAEAILNALVAQGFPASLVP
ncbi:MAG: heavy-metal-associated domain-containing protein [Pseudomonadota bacterium]|jgi:copper chaperone